MTCYQFLENCDFSQNQVLFDQFQNCSEHNRCELCYSFAKIHRRFTADDATKIDLVRFPNRFFFSTLSEERTNLFGHVPIVYEYVRYFTGFDEIAPMKIDRLKFCSCLCSCQIIRFLFGICFLIKRSCSDRRGFCFLILSLIVLTKKHLST